MSIKNRIGIIGKGFVGSAVAHGFSAQTGYSAEIRIFDKDPISHYVVSSFKRESFHQRDEDCIQSNL